MKFYSEKLDQMFDSVEELQSAEAKKRPAKKKCVEKEQIDSTEAKGPKTPSRKELAEGVNNAEEKLKEAYLNYDAAKQKVEDLSKKYLEEINSILAPAQQEVKCAEQARYEAIARFNDAYGAYQVTYSGAKAADDMLKAISNINARANNILRELFWA